MLWRLWGTVHDAGGEQGGLDRGERERNIFKSSICNYIGWCEEYRGIAMQYNALAEWGRYDHICDTLVLSSLIFLILIS